MTTGWRGFPPSWPFLGIAVAVCLLLVDAGALRAAARLEVVEGSVSKDFGTVRRREKLEAKVVLRNVGDAPAVLDAPRASCSACETLLVSSTKVAPGQLTTLTMRLDSGRETGPRTGEWVVRTNAEVPKAESGAKPKVTSDRLPVTSGN